MIQPTWDQRPRDVSARKIRLFLQSPLEIWVASTRDMRACWAAASISQGRQSESLHSSAGQGQYWWRKSSSAGCSRRHRERRDFCTKQLSVWQVCRCSQFILLQHPVHYNKCHTCIQFQIEASDEDQDLGNSFRIVEKRQILLVTCTNVI